MFVQYEIRFSSSLNLWVCYVTFRQYVTWNFKKTSFIKLKFKTFFSLKVVTVYNLPRDQNLDIFNVLIEDGLLQSLLCQIGLENVDVDDLARQINNENFCNKIKNHMHDYF